MMRARGVWGQGAAPLHKICESCGARLRNSYIRTHQRKHCPGRDVGEVEDGELTMVVVRDGPQEEEEEEGGVALHVDEVLADLDQTILGAVGGGLGRDEGEEEEALALQRHLQQQRLNAERTLPASPGISASSSG